MMKRFLRTSALAALMLFIAVGTSPASIDATAGISSRLARKLASPEKTDTAIAVWGEQE